MRFSERHGFKRPSEAIQTNSMTPALRNCLWNILNGFIWEMAENLRPQYGSRHKVDGELMNFWISLQMKYFKRTIDDGPQDLFAMAGFVRDYFFRCDWFEVYDLLQFVADEYPYGDHDSFVESCNIYLKQELAGYRFVNGTITAITSEEEIEAIETAVAIPLDPVREHLRSALKKLSERPKPDARNSVKESISAIESLLNLTFGKHDSLGDLIKKHKTEFSIHPALLEALNKLYGYTSNADGVRHALIDESSLDADDAKFFLVICSAFVNLLKSKGFTKFP